MNNDATIKLKQFIDFNYDIFSGLGNSEVEVYNIDQEETGYGTLDGEIIEYLKEHYRFDWEGICVYYVKENNEVWVENMNS